LTAAVVASCGFALFLGACAITNTPQQDLAYARWAKCNAPFVSLEWVDLDGRITFRFSTEGGRQEVLISLEWVDLDGRITFRFSTEGGRQAVLQCLAEAGRTGPPLPEPVGVRPPSGP